MKKENDGDASKRQAIREQIDENLKRVYAAALNEELPDRFRDLLAQLKAKEGPGSALPPLPPCHTPTLATGLPGRSPSFAPSRSAWRAMSAAPTTWCRIPS